LGPWEPNPPTHEVPPLLSLGISDAEPLDPTLAAARLIFSASAILEPPIGAARPALIGGVPCGSHDRTLIIPWTPIGLKKMKQIESTKF
jgi:hypothetical protein